MAKPILNKQIPKSCDYCFFGKKSSAFDTILCKYKGPVTARNFCRKYKYDPLKRVPVKVSDIGTYTEEDFKLD